ncbi:hypothetical protein [Macrococcus brunensis]|uniref:hypothetical protein n=1 Tax=Macrococcus brunensis TaxID=198483 RepID=UPI001EF0A403|nr:hypothetical protein [Macrococcus brunensis]ULG74232.1 hypothetical protein MGG13_00210 [Macrococcus brunensis]
MKKYNLSFLEQQVNYGEVRFEINNAVIKEINSTNGIVEVISMDVTLTDQRTQRTDRLPSYLLFINENPKSDFGQFVREYATKIDQEGFDNGAELIGIQGTVDYYVNSKGYETLSRWKFNIPSSAAQAQLINHVKQNTAIIQPLQPHNEGLNDLDHNAFDNFTPSFHTDANIPENTVGYFDFEYGQADDMEDNDYV